MISNENVNENENHNENENENQIKNWFLFYSVLTLIASLTFGIVYREIPSLSSITQVQAQILFISALFTLVGIVGMIQVMLFPGEEE